jgi:hypothetical protein
VKLITAAFEAQYGVLLRSPRYPHPEAILITLPPFRAAMCRPTVREQMNVLVRLRSTTQCHSSSVISNTGFRRLPPALLTRMSTLPKASIAFATKLSTLSVFVTSQGITKALRPRCSISLPTDSISPSVRAVMTKSAPASAIARAIARPKPRPEPVTMAIFPANDSCSLIMDALRYHYHIP